MNRREFIGGAAALSLVGWRKAARAAGYPDYYAEQFASAADRVRRLSKTCPFGFWFLTDLHIPSNRLNSGGLLSAFVKETPLTTVLCGGDLPEAFRFKFPTDRAAVDFAVETYRERWVAPIRAAGGKVYTARGNHDFTVCTAPDVKTGFTYDGAKTRRWVVGEFSERSVVTNAADPEGCYYCFDDAAARVRTVVGRRVSGTNDTAPNDTGTPSRSSAELIAEGAIS